MTTLGKLLTFGGVVQAEEAFYISSLFTNGTGPVLDVALIPIMVQGTQGDRQITRVRVHAGFTTAAGATVHWGIVEGTPLFPAGALGLGFGGPRQPLSPYSQQGSNPGNPTIPYLPGVTRCWHEGFVQVDGNASEVTWPEDADAPGALILKSGTSVSLIVWSPQVGQTIAANCACDVVVTIASGPPNYRSRTARSPLSDRVPLNLG